MHIPACLCLEQGICLVFLTLTTEDGLLHFQQCVPSRNTGLLGSEISLSSLPLTETVGLLQYATGVYARICCTQLGYQGMQR